MPASFERLGDEVSRRWPELADRMQYVEDDLARVETDRSVLVTSVHACGPLTDSCRSMGHDTSLFPRLVLGWIEADFRVQIHIF